MNRPRLLLPPLAVFLVAAPAALAACDSCSSKPAATAATDAGPAMTEDATPSNALVLPTASVAAQVNPEGLPAYAGPTGAVEGTVTIVGDRAPETPADFSRCPDAERIYGRAFREGAPSGANGARPLADVIVGVTGYSGFYVPEKAEVKELAIEGCGFTQRTVTMTFGQRLEVKNRTKDFWTPQLHSARKAVMMMASPNGDPVKLYPAKPGHHLVFDHDRRWAVVDVYAMLYPLHAVTDLAGHFRIDGVPVGKLKVSARHPRIAAESSVDVDVREGVVHKVDLQLELHAVDAIKTYDAGAVTYPKLR